MAKISKVYSFEAMHHLPMHKGKCSRPHGHSYQVQITLDGPIRKVEQDPERIVIDSDAWMVRDYGDIDEGIKDFIEVCCDHRNLNETLKIPRTTAELIACVFFGVANSVGLPVSSVTVKETQKTRATVTLSDWLAVGKPYETGWRATL